MEEISTQALSATSASFSPLLQQELAQAQEAARNRQQPVLFRWHMPFEVQDPWHVCAVARRESEPFFVWQEPRAGFCLAAWGLLAWETLAATDNVCALAQTHHQQWAQACWNAGKTAEAAEDVPFVLSTLAFSSADTKEGIWQNWQAGAVFVPRVMVCTQPETQGAPARSWAVLAQWIHPTDALPKLIQRIDADLAQLEAAVGTGQALPEGSDSELLPIISTASALWDAQIQQAQQDMAAGRVGKVVLARQAVLQAPADAHFDAWQSVCALRHQDPSALVYAVGAPNGECFLGASPELLLCTQHTEVRTQAVAGTIAMGDNPEKTALLGARLMQSRKDRHEHQIVVEALQKTLQPWCKHLSVPTVPTVVPMRRLQHLVTPLSGTLKDKENILHLVHQLHPTPATAGFPQQAAKAWLTKYERLDRGLYAGPIGWMTQAQDGKFAVALRSMLITPKVTYAFAGAGIVPDSVAAAEWEETQLKLTAVRHALVVQHPTADR